MKYDTDEDEQVYDNILFDESIKGKFIPRSVFVDLDSMTIDEVKSGYIGDLLLDDNLIFGKEDASCNFCKGRSWAGK